MPCAPLSHGAALLATLTLVAGLTGGCDGAVTERSPDVDEPPSTLTLSDLDEGVWLEEREGPGDRRILQFTTVERARALYGGLGVDAVSRFGLSPATMDQALALFGDDEPLVLEFRASTGRAHGVIATRIRDETLGWRAAGDVGGRFGVLPDAPVPILRFVPGDELVLDGSVAFGVPSITFRWWPDCRWRQPSGWERFHNPVEVEGEAPVPPWVTAAFTRAGELAALHRPSTPGHGASLWREGACPVSVRRTFPFATGAWLGPWGERGLIGFRHTPSGLSGVRLDLPDELLLGREGPARPGTIHAARRVADDEHVLLEQDAQDAFDAWLPLRRARLQGIGEASEWPLPEAPAGVGGYEVYLMPSGRVAATWVSSPPEGGPATRGWFVEGMDGAWEALPTAATTQTGEVVDLARPELAPALWVVDDAGRLTVLVAAEGVLPALHPGRALGSALPALVRLEAGEAEVHLLPHGAYSDLQRMEVDEDGVVHAFGIYHGGPRPDDLSHIVWPPGEAPRAQHPGLPVSPAGAPGFYDPGRFRGAVIDHQRRYAFGPDGAVIVSNGWRDTFFRPPATDFRPARDTLTLQLVDPPPGALLRGAHAPAFECAETCAVTVDRGAAIGLRFDLPPGWLVAGPPGWCTPRDLDAGFCHAVAEGDGELAYTFRRTPIEALSATHLGDAVIAALPAGDGAVAAVVARVEEGVTAIAIARWEATEPAWEWPVEPGLAGPEALGVAHDGDLLALLAPRDGAPTTFADPASGADLALEGADLLLLRLGRGDGAPRAAVVVRYPPGLTPQAVRLTPSGGLLVFGDLAESDEEATGALAELELEPGHDVLLRYEPDGEPALLHAKPSPAEPAEQIEVLLAITPAGHALLLRREDGGFARRVFSSTGEALVDDLMTAELPGSLWLEEHDGALLAAAPVSGAFSLDGFAGEVSGDGVVVMRLDDEGRVTRLAPLSVGQPVADALLKGFAALDDGRFVAAWGTAGGGEEILLVEGIGSLRIGEPAVPAPAEPREGEDPPDDEPPEPRGYDTRLLAGLDGGRVLWVGRAWSPQIMRPYVLTGAFSAVLDTALLPEAGPLLRRPDTR